jgi:hypothetical protein
MDETQLREELRAMLDDVTPPAELLDGALEHLGPSERSMRRRALVCVALAVTVALVVGIAVAAHGSRKRVDVVNTPTTISSDLAAISSMDPIDDLLNREGGVSYMNAVETSVARCMHARGWVYVPRIGNPAYVYGAGRAPTDPAARVSYLEHYGWGYLNDVPSDADAGARIDVVNNDYFHSLAPAAQLRYSNDLGPDTGGGMFGRMSADSCRGAAELAERTIIPLIPRPIERELSTRHDDILKDPAYLAAQTKWSSCMLGQGFHFEHTTDPQASMSNLFAPPPSDPNSQVSARAHANARALARAAALERRTASADARCAAPTVWPVQRRLELAILQDVLDRYGRKVVCGRSCH